MVNEKSSITGHYIAHWGPPTEIRPRNVKGIEAFAVLEFAPRGERATWRYATNGMSSCPQRCSDPNVTVRTELYACTRERVTWADDLLAAIATYPQDCSTFLADGDSIDVGQSIDRRASAYTGILLAPPGPFDAPTLGIVGGISDNVLVHQIVGLLPGEVQYAEHKNTQELWKRIVKHGEPLLDVTRGAVVSYQ